jgi:hypothetical protein
MLDDQLIDQLLRDAMAAVPAPQLSPAFDARLMQRIRRRRLTSIGRVVVAVYIAGAVTMAVWLMGDLTLETVAAAVAIGVPIAAAGSAYGRRFATGR